MFILNSFWKLIISEFFRHIYQKRVFKKKIYKYIYLVAVFNELFVDLTAKSNNMNYRDYILFLKEKKQKKIQQKKTHILDAKFMLILLFFLIFIPDTSDNL